MNACLRFVLPPQCYTWHGRARCTRKASVYLFAPDGTPNPGGWVCKEHGDATVAEYRDKLGEVWTTRPLMSDGARAAAETFWRWVNRWDDDISDEEEIQAIMRFAADAVAQAVKPYVCAQELFPAVLAEKYQEGRKDGIEWAQRALGEPRR